MNGLMWSAVIAGVVCAGCQSSPFQSVFKQKSGPAGGTQNVDESNDLTPWNRGKGAAGEAGLVAGATTRNSGGSSELIQAHAAYRAGRIDEAKSLYGRVLQNDPRNAAAHHRLATIADQQRDFPTASLHYKAALLADPKNAELLGDVGWSNFLQGRYAEGEYYLKQSLKIDPTNKRVMHNLGWLYGKENKRKLAYDLFRRAGSDEHARRMLAKLDASRTRHPDNELPRLDFSRTTPAGLRAPDPRSTRQTSYRDDDPRGSDARMSQDVKDVLAKMRRAKEESIARRNQSREQNRFDADPRSVDNRRNDNRGSDGYRGPQDRIDRDPRYTQNSQRSPADSRLNDRMRDIDSGAPRRRPSAGGYDAATPDWKYADAPTQRRDAPADANRDRGDRDVLRPTVANRDPNQTAYWPPEGRSVTPARYADAAGQRNVDRSATNQRPIGGTGDGGRYGERNAIPSRRTSTDVDADHREALRLGHNTGTGGVPFPIPNRSQPSNYRSANLEDRTSQIDPRSSSDDPRSAPSSNPTPWRGDRAGNIDYWPPNPSNRDGQPSSGRNSYRDEPSSRGDSDGPIIRPRSRNSSGTSHSPPPSYDEPGVTGFSQPRYR